MDQIKSVHPFVVEEEVIAALKECSNSEEKATIKLMDISFLQVLLCCKLFAHNKHSQTSNK